MEIFMESAKYTLSAVANQKREMALKTFQNVIQLMKRGVKQVEELAKTIEDGKDKLYNTDAMSSMIDYLFETVINNTESIASSIDEDIIGKLYSFNRQR